LDEHYERFGFRVLQLYEGNATQVYAELIDKKDLTRFVLIKDDKIIQICGHKESNVKFVEFVLECNL